MLCLASCVDNELLPPDNSNNIDDDYYFTISDNIESRVTYSGDESNFEGGEEVGIFALDASENLISEQPENARYKVKNIENITTNTLRQVLEPATQNDEVAKGCAKYLVYHPYISGLTFQTAKNLSFSVYKEQDTKIQYQNSDLLWDIATPDASRNCVNITFDHVMARIFVEIDPKALDIEKGIQVVGLAISANGIDLSTENIENLRYKTAENELFNLSMNFVNVIGSGRYMFGALVPAQTLKKGQPILKITTKDGTEKEYKLPATDDIELRSGYNYTISLRDKHDVTIDVDEDASWVFDVRDPVTGEIVGMLCREYIRFQPEATFPGTEKANMGTPDFITGYEINVNGVSTKAISSQAWVFYNLKEGYQKDNIPNLNEGTVLRFIKDVRYALSNEQNEQEAAHLTDGRKTCDGAWPAPHTFFFETYGAGGVGAARGVFLANHGHDWIFDSADRRGKSSENVFENYMHGGKLTWGNLHNDYITYNGITMFTLPEQQITNSVAVTNGHIAHDPVTGEAYVSYERYNPETQTDDKGMRVCFIDPVFITDARTNKVTGDLEVNTYPLVKIGYNNFWAKKGLRTKLLNDGTPLKNFSTLDGGWTFGTNFIGDIGSGYLYPYHEKYALVNDPSNQENFGKLYNHTAVKSNKLATKNVDIRFNCSIPRIIRFYETVSYTGWMFTNKFISTEMRTRYLDSFSETEEEALRENKLVDSPSTIYTCNATGFDLRSLGLARWWYSSMSWDAFGGSYSLGIHTLYWLDSRNDQVIEQLPASVNWTSNSIIGMGFQPWSAWKGEATAQNIIQPGGSYIDTKNYETENTAKSHISQMFMGVREVMKMKYQSDPNPYETLSLIHI